LYSGIFAATVKEEGSILGEQACTNGRGLHPGRYCPHPLSEHAAAVSKNHYPHIRIRIEVLAHVDAVINRIRIPLYTIYIS